MFFPKLRAHAKWVFVLLVVVFAGGFVFLGVGENPATMAMTVKLTDSREQALMAPGAEPTGYGLGRAGWVTIPLRDTTPPLEVLTDWVEESYRTVAPKRLVAKLDERSG